MPQQPDTPPSGEHSVADRIVNASVLILIAHFAFKIAGLVQYMVMGRFVDSAVLEPVYHVAFENVIFSFFLIGEEVIGPTFLPIFMRQKDDHGEEAAWAFANVVLSIQFLILIGTVLFLVLFPDIVLNIILDWDEVSDPTKFGLARSSLVWLAPSLVFLSLGSTTYMLLNGYKRFFLAAFGDASWKFFFAGSVAVGVGFLGFGYRCLIFGLLVGSAMKLLTHLAGLFLEIHHFRFRLDLQSKAVRTMFFLMLPLIGGIIFAKCRDIFNNVYILSATHTDGLIQANSFGRKLYTTASWLIPYTLSIAMFPYLCEMVDKKDDIQFGKVLTTTSRMLLAIFIPIAMVCVVVAEPITALLFEGGKFDSQMTTWTAIAMAGYTLVLPAAAVETVLMQGFFAHRRTFLITTLGICFSLVSIAISFVGINILGYGSGTALAIVALGFVISRILKVIALAFFIRHHAPTVLPPLTTLSLILKALAIGAFCTTATYAVDLAFIEHVSAAHGTLTLLVRLAADGAAAAIMYLLTMKALGMVEPEIMLGYVLKRLGFGK